MFTRDGYIPADSVRPRSDLRSGRFAQVQVPEPDPITLATAEEFGGMPPEAVGSWRAPA